ncbi:MAG: hypothetical protein K8R52_00835 [Bacteroidales bacterium]|nr:hypothetical protein [Bacteroidales bacterium]
MKILVSFLVFVGLILSCERTAIDGVDLIGKWLVIRDCDSCVTYEFEKGNNLIIHQIGRDYSNSYEYKLYRDNTIQIDYRTTKDRYDIVVYSVDTIEIMGFTISGIPEEMNTLLKRMYE